MNRKTLSVAFAVLVSLQASGAAAPQQPSQGAAELRVTALPRPFASAVPAAESPTIDGLLDERAWQEAPPFTGMIQAEPAEGAPSSERTDVRFIFDDQAMYIGVVLHDRSPGEIVETESRRDANLNDQDSIQVIFDTFHDRQNGFIFGTNVAGAQYDAQVRNQSRPEASWDGSWDVKTRRAENGWTAEFRIPLRTLRYAGAPQTWGVNWSRRIQRRRERAYWAPLARTHSMTRLSAAGELRGLNLKSPRNFKLLPYATGSANRSFTAAGDTNLDKEFGFDAKFGITPAANLDVTYNTDFAQVEVDTQQINLTRFNLRFPEKRPFFLENSGLFTVGKSDELDLFFSRRIGLDDAGTVVPITAGARVTGKVRGFNIGALNMQTDDTTRGPANNVSVWRTTRELTGRSSVGAIVVNRTTTGGIAGAGDWNRTWGGDAKLGLGERVTVSSFLARTETPGMHGREYAYNVDSEYDDGRYQVNLEYGLTGDDFQPEVGYLEKEDGYRRYYVQLQQNARMPKVRSWGFRELLTHANYTRYEYLDGRLQTADLHADNHFDWENGNFVAGAVNGTWDGLRVPFQIYPGIVVPAGEHGGLRFTLRANTDRRRWLYARTQWDVGRFLSGTQSSPTFQVILRTSGQFTVDATWNYRAITLPQGAFHTNLGNMRIVYNFTPSVFIQSLIQYNDRTDRWSTNLRFHLLETAGTGLFVVYNNTESLNGLGPVDRAFIVKYVRLFDVLK